MGELMSCGWFFRAKVAGETHREPIQGEFFATDAISDPGMALVREGIQNALDANVKEEKVLVRISLSGEGKSVPAAKVAPFFREFRPHLTAAENGLRQDDVPPPSEPCNFLLFEDFGTSGLTGDPGEAFRSKTGQKNHFYHFFRAEGQSDKDAGDRGSWGVGKHVFPRSSRISTMFGVSVRVDDRRRILMGRTILKSHWAGEKYCQDGYFGELPGASGSLVLPVMGESVLDEFCELFSLDRGKEPGLSVVVPWPDPEITEHSIINAVVRDYFVPILEGQLSVIVQTPGIETVLDSESLVGEIEKIGGSVAQELQPLLKLATWAHNLTSDQVPKLVCPYPDSGWVWSEDLFPPAVVDAARRAYNDGEPFAFRVPVTVRKKSEAPQSSFFDVFLNRDTGDHSGRPTFIREGVIISKVDAPRTRAVRAILIAKDAPLAGFLRDSENPSHTEWQYDGSNFRGKYKSGRVDLTFVKRSIHEIMQVLTESEQDADPALLLDFFSLPVGEEEEGLEGKTKKQGVKKGEQVIPPAFPPKRSARFTVQKIAGGFSVSPAGTGLTLGTQLDIRVAYDIRRGNPLKKYNSSDFEVNKFPITLVPAPQGLEIVEQQENRIVARVSDPDFRIHVKGFDERRDLFVRVTPKE